MSEIRRINRALGALASAKSRSDYRRAKLLVAGLDPVNQLAAIDSVIACRARLTAEGVL